MAAQQKAASPSAIIEAAHIKGDRVFGFRKSCLLVLSDGRYHRERYAEHSGAGLGQESWDPPQVFEGRLAATETEELMKQIDEPNFTSISGFVGEIPHLTSMLMFFPSGTVTPHEDIDVTVVSIARPQRGQMFQIGDGARRQPGISKFLDWSRAWKSVTLRHCPTQKPLNVLPWRTASMVLFPPLCRTEGSSTLMKFAPHYPTSELNHLRRN